MLGLEHWNLCTPCLHSRPALLAPELLKAIQMEVSSPKSNPYTFAVLRSWESTACPAFKAPREPFCGSCYLEPCDLHLLTNVKLNRPRGFWKDGRGIAS